MSKQKSELTHQEAIQRFSSVKSGIDYKFFFHLALGDRYSGIAHISFELHNTEFVFLDFCGERITKFKVNGKEFDVGEQEKYAEIHKNGRIHFPENSCRPDIKNLVEIHFQNSYYTDTRGIHKYVEVDGSQFIQTSTEPYWGNRFVPYFDQPDLKGRFTLSALTDKSWELITSVDPKIKTQFDEYMQQPVSNSLFDSAVIQKYSIVEGKEGLTYWGFPKSALLPTYLFAFAAGPYTKIPLSSVQLPEKLISALSVPKRDEEGEIIRKFSPKL